MVQGKRKSSYPVLKIPLDLENPVDTEVYKIFGGFSSGVEAKNFLLSAILYYSRSPLVLSANALAEALKGSDGRFDQVINKLDELLNKIGSGNSLGDLKETTKMDSLVSGEPNSSIQTCIPMDDTVRQELTSLKQKFKI